MYPGQLVVKTPRDQGAIMYRSECGGKILKERDWAIVPGTYEDCGCDVDDIGGDV